MLWLDDRFHFLTLRVWFCFVSYNSLSWHSALHVGLEMELRICLEILDLGLNTSAAKGSFSNPAPTCYVAHDGSEH